MKNDIVPDVCQLMVTNHYAYYSYMDILNLNLIDNIQEMDINAPQKDNSQSSNDNNKIVNKPYYCNNTSLAVASTDGDSYEENENNIQGSEEDDYNEEEIDCNSISATFTKLNYFDNKESHVHSAAIVETNNDGIIDGNHKQINRQNILNKETEHFYSNDNVSSVQNVAYSKTDNCVEGENTNHYIQQSTLTTESDDSKVKQKIWSAMYVKAKHLSDTSKNSNDKETLSSTTLDYSRINFKFNDVIEGTLGEVVASTRMKLLIEKINDVDLSNSKDKMYYTIMSMQCDKLPEINEIVPSE